MNAADRLELEAELAWLRAHPYASGTEGRADQITHQLEQEDHEMSATVTVLSNYTTEELERIETLTVADDAVIVAELRRRDQITNHPVFAAFAPDTRAYLARTSKPIGRKTVAADYEPGGALHLVADLDQ